MTKKLNDVNEQQRAAFDSKVEVQRPSKELVGALALLRNAEGEPWVTLRESDAKRLIAEFESLQRDAERYRWLRHGDNDEAVVRMSGNKRNNYPFLLRNDELDAMIDIKMKEQP